jgi:hypothetical protein
MFRKTLFVMMAVAAFGGAVIACVGPVGKGEGDSCNSEDQCGSDLTCQPIGDTGDFCCPTPASSSKKSACQEKDGG